MFLPVLLAVAPLAHKPAAPLIAPILPPMAAPEFQAKVGAIQKALEKSDFATAQVLVAELPKTQFTLQWDDRKVDAPIRKLFAGARDAAVIAWRDAVPSIKSTIAATGGDLKISFEPTLADDPETGTPAGIYVFASDKAPRISAAIALQRGNPLETSQAVDIYNDVLNAIGRYYGLAKNVAPGSALSAAIPGAVNRHGLAYVERTAIKQNILISDFLRKAVADKTPVKFQHAIGEVGPDRFQGEALQGDTIDFDIEIVNKGTGPLAYRVEGDCGCIVASPPGTIPAQSKMDVHVNLDTKEFTTITTRNIRVYTNDPTEPVRVIPVSLDVKPRFRFLTPGGNARNIAENGTTFDVFLAIPEGGEFSVRAARLSGIDGKVAFEKWEGTLPDPDRGEGPVKRKGYKFRLQVPPNLPSGRAMVGLNVVTDSLEFPTLSHTITVQKGAVATPEELFLGDLGKLKKSATFLVTKPGAALKIVSVSIDAKSLKATVLPGRNENEAKIRVEYDGTAPAGELSATVTLKLADPKQPELLVPILATVR